MNSYVPRFHRVYIVDDHDIVRRGLRDLLVAAEDIDVVGDSGSVRAAVPEIARLECDVVLLDLQLQDGTGIEICRAVRAADPSVSGLLLTASGDDEALAATVLAGAAGYLVKQSRGTDIVGTIRKLRPGVSVVDTEGLERAKRVLGAVLDALDPPLTEGERQVMELVMEGRTDSEIEGTDPVPLVLRVADALLGRVPLSFQPGAGRHRRPD